LWQINVTASYLLTEAPSEKDRINRRHSKSFEF